MTEMNRDGGVEDNQGLVLGINVQDTIRDLAKKGSACSEKDAARIVRQMLTCAAARHENGVAHRDMKPTSEDNFLLAQDSALKKNSGSESDDMVKRIGEFAYFLLCGRHPFRYNNEQISKPKPEFREGAWQSTVSHLAQVFVKKLLESDSHKRPTAEEAMKNIWVMERGIADHDQTPLDESVLKTMSKLVEHSNFKQWALEALKSILTEEDIRHHYRAQFDVIDVDKDGKISVAELRQALKKNRTVLLKVKDVKETLAMMDTNGDEMVDFDEFMEFFAAPFRGQTDLVQTNSTKASQEAFSKLNADGNGYITALELEMTSAHLVDKESIDTLISEADTDGDGQISLPEFQKLLHQALFGPRTNNQ